MISRLTRASVRVIRLGLQLRLGLISNPYFDLDYSGYRKNFKFEVGVKKRANVT